MITAFAIGLSVAAVACALLALHGLVAGQLFIGADRLPRAENPLLYWALIAIYVAMRIGAAFAAIVTLDELIYF